MKRMGWMGWMTVALVALVVTAALAGAVYDRTTVTLTAGAGTWTANHQYASVGLKRIWIEGSTLAVNTVTVQRVTSDLAYTQACASVVLAANKGNSATFTAGYLKYGDKLVFSSSAPSNSVAIIDYEVCQH